LNPFATAKSRISYIRRRRHGVFITLNNHLRRSNSNTPRSIIMSQSSSSAPSSTAPSSQCEKGISDSQSTVSSGLSSVPSDLFTPTLGSNPVEPEQQESQDLRVPDIFLGKRKARTSIIWNPENGREVEISGQRRWRCNRCESPASAVLETPCLFQSPASAVLETPCLFQR
jgi:hypothetical protein